MFSIYVLYICILSDPRKFTQSNRVIFSCLVDMSSYFRSLFCASSQLFLSVVLVVTKCQTNFAGVEEFRNWTGYLVPRLLPSPPFASLWGLNRLSCSQAAPVSTICLLVRSEQAILFPGCSRLHHLPPCEVWTGCLVPRLLPSPPFASLWGHVCGCLQRSCKWGGRNSQIPQCEWAVWCN